MRRLVPVLAVVCLGGIPSVAGATSFEAPALVGDFAFVSDPGGEAQITIDTIGPGTRIIGPRGMRGIACRNRSLELRRCAKLKRTRTASVWTVRKPVRLTHMQTGAFTLTLRRAKGVSGIFVSGCGSIRLAGTGSYSADGAESVSYTPSDTALVITLEP